MNTDKLIRAMPKIDRVAAWTMFFVVIFYAITGYGMTKGLIDYNIAQSWHLGWLGLIGVIAFTIHTSWAIHLAFRRWKIWNRYSKSILISFFALTVLFFMYLNFFYNANSKNSSLSQNLPTNDHDSKTTIDTRKDDDSEKTENDNSSAESSSTIFTAEILSQYNGKNGQPAYVAINGKVYDVSSLYVNGEHRGCSAGKEITNAFYKQHMSRVLDRFEIIGTYEA